MNLYRCEYCSREIAAENPAKAAEAGWLIARGPRELCPLHRDRYVEPERVFFGPHTLTLTEEQRKLVLMALAHLAVERPGFRAALQEISAPIDNASDSMFEVFERIHGNLQKVAGFVEPETLQHLREIAEFPVESLLNSLTPEQRALVLERLEAKLEADEAPDLTALAVKIKPD